MLCDLFQSILNISDGFWCRRTRRYARDSNFIEELADDHPFPDDVQVAHVSMHLLEPVLALGQGAPPAPCHLKADMSSRWCLNSEVFKDMLCDLFQSNLNISDSIFNEIRNLFIKRRGIYYAIVRYSDRKYIQIPNIRALWEKRPAVHRWPLGAAPRKF